jgi:hypothetical protein
MWLDRKTRFTVIMLVLVVANFGLWLSRRAFDYPDKKHPAVFTFVFLLDVVVFIGFARLGLVTSWLLAFRPEAFKRSIERSIAKRNSN